MKIIENRERSIQKKFRVNEKENERIKLMMKETGINNFSIFARRACCNKEIFSIDFSEY
ncbi:plasmid mobilization relaxosome protein MobC, partial [Lactococcus lactis]|nr:plasmid mobilization relaxosome protein MobC [Lactococcus lactis]